MSFLPQNYAMETSCLLPTGCKPGEGQRQASASWTFVPAELGRRLGRDGLAIAGNCGLLGAKDCEGAQQTETGLGGGKSCKEGN